MGTSVNLWLTLGVLWLVCKALCNPVYVVEANDEERSPYRLPTSVRPSFYVVDLKLGTDFSETKTFTGSVKITLRSDQPITEIKLNSVDIDYSDALFEITALLGEDEGGEGSGEGEGEGEGGDGDGTDGGETDVLIDELFDAYVNLTNIDAAHEQITLTIQEPETGLEASVDYELTISNFVGTLHEDMFGFYISSYTNESGETE